MSKRVGWMADVLIDLVRYSERNQLPETSKYLRLARATLLDANNGVACITKPDITESIDDSQSSSP